MVTTVTVTEMRDRVSQSQSKSLLPTKHKFATDKLPFTLRQTHAFITRKILNKTNLIPLFFMPCSYIYLLAKIAIFP